MDTFPTMQCNADRYDGIVRTCMIILGWGSGGLVIDIDYELPFILRGETTTKLFSPDKWNLGQRVQLVK